jgi:hypothetical protein
LTEALAKTENFTSLDHFKATLKDIYPEITDSTQLAVIYFNVLHLTDSIQRPSTPSNQASSPQAAPATGNIGTQLYAPIDSFAKVPVGSTVVIHDGVPCSAHLIQRALSWNRK